MRAYKREWIAARRAAYFADKCCAQCGSTERLELDHIVPSTKEHHAIWSWSKSRRDAELLKCQPLCHDCRQRKTSAENSARMMGKPFYSARGFTPDQVHSILGDLKSGVGVRKIADSYGVSHSIISDIKRGVTYRDITQPGGAQ